MPGTWRRGASPETLEQRLKDDTARELKAVVVVHNETSTGVVSRIADLRRAMNRTGHPALLIVDAISSLASIDLRHDEWEIDVTVCGSQKGLMVPPGLGFNAISEKALAANAKSKLPKSYWNWDEMLKANKSGFFPYTPATNLLYGLREALRMLDEEGFENVLQPPRAAWRGDARRRARVGTRHRPRGSSGVLELADRGLHAGRPQRRSAAADHPRALRHVARHRTRQARRARLPHRPSRDRSTI